MRGFKQVGDSSLNLEEKSSHPSLHLSIKVSSSLCIACSSPGTSCTFVWRRSRLHHVAEIARDPSDFSVIFLSGRERIFGVRGREVERKGSSWKVVLIIMRVFDSKHPPEAFFFSTISSHFPLPSPPLSRFDVCSPFSTQVDYFNQAIVGNGVSGRWFHNHVHSSPECLTLLEPERSKHLRSRERMQLYVSEMGSESSCSAFNSQDPYVTGGLSRLIDEMASKLLLLAEDDNAAGATRTYPPMMMLERYIESLPDMHLGTMKAMLYLVEEVLQAMDLSRAALSAVYYTGLLVFLMQVREIDTA